ADLTRPGEIIHACENPQVLQRLATAGVEHPVACMSGNPAAAGMTLLARTVVLYHGDFDWPGIAIARRVFDRGARPWRFGRIDYVDAVDRLPTDNRLALSLLFNPFCLRVFVLGWSRLTVLPTSWRAAGRRFLEPGGRPGPGLP